ncbi:MAG: hypothetical protein DHS20C19_07880 [Acidimicrobiales bacterium]|nr:MAG: hypothetical protein DHS20C19_07880 [Acidimicrobiales bacterium]
MISVSVPKADVCSLSMTSESPTTATDGAAGSPVHVPVAHEEITIVAATRDAAGKTL